MQPFTPPAIDDPFPDAGAEVRLRRLGFDDLDWLAAFDSDEQAVGEHNWSGPQTPDEVRLHARNRLERDGWVGPLDGNLLIEVHTGTGAYAPAGTVGWHPRRWGPQPESVAFVLGVAIHPDFRGRGVGVTVHRLLVDLLFATTPVHRIEADTAVDNPAEIKCLERAGFQREGTVRSAEFRNGRHIDHELYSIVRDRRLG